MLKFLFYLFIFYIVYRYVFGGFKVKVFHYHQHKPPTQPNYTSYEEEGSITINPKVNTKKKNTKDNLGEYVDYEEVK